MRQLYWFAARPIHYFDSRDSNLEMRKKCHFFEAFFEAFVDLFGAFFLSLKDHFCVSRIVLSHAKIHKSDNDGIIFCLGSLYMVLSYQRTCIAVSPILV